MLQKARKKLTILCAGITIFILAAMSLGCLYISESSLKRNQYASFQGDVNTMISTMEKQTVFTHEALSKLENSGKYNIYVFDNGVPFSFNGRTQTENQAALCQEILNYYNDAFAIKPLSTEFFTNHFEFSFSSDITHSSYYISAAELRRENGNLSVLILYPLTILKLQINRQRILFLILDLAAALLLFVFASYFTKKILLPVEESQKEQTHFIAAASHELRTPLSVMLSAVSASRCADSAERERFLDTVVTEGNRMSSLINDMLTLARADHHTWSVRKAPVQIDTLLLNSVETFEAVAAGKDIHLSIRLPEEILPPYVCDASRITQVIAILLQNAITYTQEKGFVHISLNRSDKALVISVADNGIGIPEEERQLIFKRFYRIEKSRNEKDHFGLGLCIAQEIMNAHQGTILVKDTLGGGSTFVLRLPL